MSTCKLNEPHDCANVRAANSALRRHLDAACKRAEDAEKSDRESLEMYRRCRDRADALARRVATLERRLARVLRRAQDSEWLSRKWRNGEGGRGTGVWSGRRKP